MKLNTIIVEDEPLARSLLEEYVSRVSFLNHQASFIDPIKALDYVEQTGADVLFLDIHLPEMSGLDFLKQLDLIPQVILTTAYHQYALQGYEYNVVDYLLKPIEETRFLQAVDKLSIPDPKFLIVKENKITHKLLMVNVVWLESQGDYIEVNTRNGTQYRMKATLSSILNKLPKRFIQIHRSFVINAQFVTSFTQSSVTIGELSFNVGRKYKDNIVLLAE